MGAMYGAACSVLCLGLLGDEIPILQWARFLGCRCGVLRARRRGAVAVIRAMRESDHVLHAIESSRPHLPCKFCMDTTWRARVVEDSRAHRYRGGSGEQEFQGVSTGSDTSHSDDRDGGKRVMHLPDAAQSDRSDSRPGEPTGCSRQRRAHGGRVDYQAEQRVDQGQARGPARITASAISTMSVTSGDNFAKIGIRASELRRTVCTT